VVDVADQVSQPPGCVEHPDGCSATRVAPRSTRTRTDSMTTSVLRSSEGGGSRPPEPEFRQHDGLRVAEIPQSHYRLQTRGAHCGRGEEGEKTEENRSRFGVIFIFSRISVY
jgi:hypothetical protein